MPDWPQVATQGFRLGEPRPTSAGPKPVAAKANPSGGRLALAGPGLPRAPELIRMFVTPLGFVAVLQTATTYSNAILGLRLASP